MSEVLGPWRATYAPGDWIVLAGPTSLVLIQPLVAEWSTLIDTLWQEVLACSTITELTEQLVAFGIADMPSFGAFFWTDEGMRSLVRGGIVVREAESGRTVADGNGVQTWSEVGLGTLDRIRIEVPRAETGLMELPLLVGAVFASAVTLDARAGARVSSVQRIGSLSHGSPLTEDEPSPLSSSEKEDLPASEDLPDTEDLPGTEDLTGTEDFAEHPDAVRALMENASTELMPIPDVLGPQDTELPAEPDASALATLALSDGRRIDLVGVVRIGRAPSPELGAESDAELVTLASPQQDISRTHLQVHPQDGQVVVTDLNSTNGTLLVLPDTPMYSQRLPPGQPVAVPPGSLLDLGDGVSLLIELPDVRLHDHLI